MLVTLVNLSNGNIEEKKCNFTVHDELILINTTLDFNNVLVNVQIFIKDS